MFKATLTTQARVVVDQWVPDTDKGDKFTPGHWEELSVADAPIGSFQIDLKPGQSITFWIDPA